MIKRLGPKKLRNSLRRHEQISFLTCCSYDAPNSTGSVFLPVLQCPVAGRPYCNYPQR